MVLLDTILPTDKQNINSLTHYTSAKDVTEAAKVKQYYKKAFFPLHIFSSQN